MSKPIITVRRAVPDDIPIILTFLHKLAVFNDDPEETVQATAATLQQMLFRQPPLAYVEFAEIDNQAVGFISYSFTCSTFVARPGIWLEDLYVDADRRSQGVGQVLLEYLARLAQSMHCGRIEWMASARNERGLAFYRKNGATIREGYRLCKFDDAAIEQLAGGGMV